MFHYAPERSDKMSLIKTAVFGVLSVLFLITFILGLSMNSQGSVEKYNTLIAADEAGGDVETALNDLRSHIYSHMNSEIGGGENSIYPPIQLSGTYKRLVEAEEARVEKANEDLYAKAQDYCEATGSQGFSGRNRVDCINKYVDNNGTEARPIDDSFYKYDFVAPRWSPDIAGVSLVLLIIFSLLTFYNAVNYLRIRHMVHMGN